MEQVEFVMPTPGSLFREKRRKLGWGIKDVADELLLSVSQVEAIEQDDFESLPETPYIVGYWRSYGNLLGIDISKEIDSYKESHDTPLSNIVFKPNHRSAHHLQEKLRKKSALVFFVLSVLFLGVIWYWQTPENMFVTRWSDMNTDPQLVMIDVEDKTEPGIADPPQFDTQELSVIVLPEPNFSEGLGVDDEQESDRSELNLPENLVPQREQHPLAGSEQVQENHMENPNDGSVNQGSISSNLGSAGESTDQSSLSGNQIESQGLIATAEVTGPSAGQVETVALEPENTVPEVVAAPPGAVEESIQGETTEETVETEEQEGSPEDGNSPAEVAEAPIPVVPPVDTVNETIETGLRETSLESSIGTAIDPTSENQIVVHVEKRIWLDIREQDGRKLLFRNVQSGESLIINGKPPFWVYLSEADSARVVYLGQPVEFDANEGEQFVRIVVGEFARLNTREPVAASNE